MHNFNGLQLSSNGNGEIVLYFCWKDPDIPWAKIAGSPASMGYFRSKG